MRARRVVLRSNPKAHSAAAGIALPEGTILNKLLGASADGTVLVGTAMDVDFVSKTCGRAGAPAPVILVQPPASW
jgi:hypothetical protein